MRLSLVKIFCLIFVALCFVTIVYNIYNNGNPEVLEAWTNRTRNMSAYISPREDTAIHLPTRFCDSEIFLLVIVCSAPEKYVSRKVIRDTWASQNEVLNLIIDFYFFVGRTDDLVVQGHIEDEYVEYDDIIQEDFMESYYNLTVKSLFMLKNVERHCKRAAKYLLKIDDDMYLNIQNLVKTLSKADNQDLITGYVFEHIRPIRSPWSKWHAPYHLYNEDYYPPFVSGTAYVMSIDVVEKLYEASFDIPLYHLEDVYVTGILAKSVGLKPKNNEYFSEQRVTYAPCAFINLITSHGYTDQQLSKLYQKVTSMNLKELCATKCRHPYFIKCFA